MIGLNEEDIPIDIVSGNKKSTVSQLAYTIDRSNSSLGNSEDDFLLETKEVAELKYSAINHANQTSLLILTCIGEIIGLSKEEIPIENLKRMGGKYCNINTYV